MFRRLRQVLYNPSCKFCKAQGFLLACRLQGWRLSLKLPPASSGHRRPPRPMNAWSASRRTSSMRKTVLRVSMSDALRDYCEEFPSPPWRGPTNSYQISDRKSHSSIGNQSGRHKNSPSGHLAAETGALWPPSPPRHPIGWRHAQKSAS